MIGADFENFMFAVAVKGSPLDGTRAGGTSFEGHSGAFVANFQIASYGFTSSDGRLHREVTGGTYLHERTASKRPGNQTEFQIAAYRHEA